MKYNEETLEKTFIRINDSDKVESINVRIADYPNLFNAKVEELMEECGHTREKAEHLAKDIEIELELYYHKGAGVFGVESGAVGACTAGGLYSPYDGETELMEEEEYNEFNNVKED